MKSSIKITVVKRLLHKELVERYTKKGDWQLCPVLNEGDEFISTNLEMPSGFCDWAWVDIQKFVMALARGADFEGVKRGTFITCCSDGFRPVIFKLERTEE
jgi:uncharacterized repeat protein (TIGR04076 family)